MFGMGWLEMLVIGVVALIVVGPEDFPSLFRKVGNAVGKARGMAREFTNAMNDAAGSSGIKEAMDSVNSVADTFKEPTKVWSNYTPGAGAEETERLDEVGQGMDVSDEISADEPMLEETKND